MSSRRVQQTLAVVLGITGGAALGVLALTWWLAPVPAPTAMAPMSKAATPLVAEAHDAGQVSERPRTPRRGAVRIPARVPPTLTKLTETHEWPIEPPTPNDIDEARFATALELLCGPYADKVVKAWYAPWTLRAAREHGADAFLLGALMFHQSGCSEAHKPPRDNLTGLDASLYRHDLSHRRYRFQSFDEGSWMERSIALTRFPFSDEFLRSPESNLYFAAAFLRAWSEQTSGLRASLVHPSDYRHYVSHFVWGDRVVSHREEDAILVERRRLLQYYGGLAGDAVSTWRGFALGCPLDGCPRLITSTLGDARDQGMRLHAGNDFESTRGEPVRAVADGVVVFAGVDLPGRGAASRIPIWAQRNVEPEVMGAGGLYVCIDHGESSQREKLVSCYMHLEAATVVQGRTLTRGEQVGRVGTSGIKQSKPHLHFELHASDGVHRAIDVLQGLVVGHPEAHAAAEGAVSRHAFSPDPGSPQSP